MSRDKGPHVFQKEEKLVLYSNKVLKESEEEKLNFEELRNEYLLLSQNYEKLLGEVRFLTSVSDRLQNKLNRVNVNLNRANEKIQLQNQELQDTIELLTEARLGRKATTIVLLIAVILFVISEAFLEPIVDNFVREFSAGLIIKGIIALLLKPIEIIVEKHLLPKSKGFKKLLNK